MASTKYPEDCVSRDGVKCKIFIMSCAMFHTCIANRNGGRCCYYEKGVKK